MKPTPQEVRQMSRTNDLLAHARATSSSIALREGKTKPKCLPEHIPFWRRPFSLFNED